MQFKPFSGVELKEEDVQDHGYYFRFPTGPIKLVKCLLEENGFKVGV